MEFCRPSRAGIHMRQVVLYLPTLSLDDLYRKWQLKKVQIQTSGKAGNSDP